MSDPIRLGIEEASQIAESIQYRQGHWVDEPLAQSIMVVLFNCGDKYAPVSCVGGEWSGNKRDLSRNPVSGSSIPLCPNGHPCMQGFGKVLAFVDEEANV